MKKLKHSEKHTIVFDQKLVSLKGKVVIPEKLVKANDNMKRTMMRKLNK